MALGLSGSNGGIGEHYRKVLETDIKAGIMKYGLLLKTIPGKYQPLYKKAIENLEALQGKISSLEKKLPK
jgi:hypothetical protein